MQSKTRPALFQDPAAFADLLKVRAARLALRWEMGRRRVPVRQPPVGPKPVLPGPTPPGDTRSPDA